MSDQRTRKSTLSKSSGGKHNVVTHSNNKIETRSVSEEKEDKEQHKYANLATSTDTGAGHSNRASSTGFAAGSSPFGSNHSQQQQASGDVYQAAYAQAYAHFQAQFQAAYSATVTQQPYGLYAQAPAPTAPSTYYASPRPIPAMPTPFAGMPSVSAPFSGATPSTAGVDDGLANVLLAWYQSGYYTGRFQAMQEMKLHGRQ